MKRLITVFFVLMFTLTACSRDVLPVLGIMDILHNDIEYKSSNLNLKTNIIEQEYELDITQNYDSNKELLEVEYKYKDKNNDEVDESGSVSFAININGVISNLKSDGDNEFFDYDISEDDSDTFEDLYMMFTKIYTIADGCAENKPDLSNYEYICQEESEGFKNNISLSSDGTYVKIKVEENDKIMKSELVVSRIEK